MRTSHRTSREQDVEPKILSSLYARGPSSHQLGCHRDNIFMSPILWSYGVNDYTYNPKQPGTAARAHWSARSRARARVTGARVHYKAVPHTHQPIRITRLQESPKVRAYSFGRRSDLHTWFVDRCPSHRICWKAFWRMIQELVRIEDSLIPWRNLVPFPGLLIGNLNTIAIMRQPNCLVYTLPIWLYFSKP